jgi:hypothetical protein
MDMTPTGGSHGNSPFDGEDSLSPLALRQPCGRSRRAHNKPSWYLVATQDRVFQRAMAKTIRAKTMEVASSHVAVLARLEETAKKLILEAAA